jgi:hypothetical protein
VLDHNILSWQLILEIHIRRRCPGLMVYVILVCFGYMLIFCYSKFVFYQYMLFAIKWLRET